MFKRQSVYSFLIIVFIFLILFYFCFTFHDQIVSVFSKKQDDVLNVQFLQDKDYLKIDNVVPIPDSVGKTISCTLDEHSSVRCFDFTIESKVSRKVKYEIYLIKNSVSPEIKDDYIKFYLTEGNDYRPLKKFDTNILPSYSSLRVSSKNPGAKVLFSGEIEGESKQIFQLRMFLADTYIMQKELQAFSVQVLVKAL